MIRNCDVDSEFIFVVNFMHRMLLNKSKVFVKKCTKTKMLKSRQWQLNKWQNKQIVKLVQIRCPQIVKIWLWWWVGIWSGEVGVRESFDVFNLEKYNNFCECVDWFYKDRFITKRPTFCFFWTCFFVSNSIFGLEFRINFEKKKNKKKWKQ